MDEEVGGRVDVYDRLGSMNGSEGARLRDSRGGGCDCFREGARGGGGRSICSGENDPDVLS